jgi:hypothetical protein
MGRLRELLIIDLLCSHFARLQLDMCRIELEESSIKLNQEKVVSLKVLNQLN